MTHLGTKTLETPRFVLRRFTIDDARPMFQNWASEAAVTKYLRWAPHQSEDESRQILAEWLALYGKPNYYHWAIAPKEDIAAPIGSIAAVGQNDAVQMVHIGYCLGSAWWRQGIVSEALAAVIAFFFEEVGVNRIESQHDPNNPNSGRVMKKCGMRCEGILRSADWSQQGIVDAAMHAILKSEYFAQATAQKSH